MEEFVNNVKRKLFTTKLLNINSDIKLDILEYDYYAVLIKKLLVDYNYNIYNNLAFYYINGLKKHSNIPAYLNNQMYNLSADGIKNIDKTNVLIIPIILEITGSLNQHICAFYINFKYKHIIYFDSYGVKKNDGSENIRKIIKQFLLTNNIIDKSFKIYSINSPWQIFIKDDNYPWLYEESCVPILGLFTYLYFLVNSEYMIESIINFGKLIKENPSAMKDLAFYTYLALII